VPSSENYLHFPVCYTPIKAALMRKLHELGLMSVFLYSELVFQKHKNARGNVKKKHNSCRQKTTTGGSHSPTNKTKKKQLNNERV
jgi:hypothetical protein